MALFEFVLALLLGGVGLALLAPRLGVPWPTLLALAGAGLAFIPGTPEAALDPDLALALFVAPVLLDAAYDASLRDLRENWAPVGGLVLGAVVLTVLAVAAVARSLEPSLPWAAAVALGAIVAPPDAAAAAAMLRQVHLPHRVLVILEGESLLNDASALLLYRLAVGAAAGGVAAWTIPAQAVAAGAGVALGIVLARGYMAAIGHVQDEVASVVLGFLGTFGVWLLADALGLSPVLTMVAYAATLARFAPERTGARQRRAIYAVWDVAVFVLNVLAFILVGLQLRGILARLGGDIGRYAGFALAVLAVTIAVRVVWVIGYYAGSRWKQRQPGAHTRWPMPPPSAQNAVVISWCGMRGIVTLAAALALPNGFPQRDLIVFAAFGVVLGTLVLQGLTLRPLLSHLALPSDQRVEAEVSLARAETAQAALNALAASADGNRDAEARHLLVREYRARLEACAPPGDQAGDPTGARALRRIALASERARLAALRREQRIGDDAFHRIEEELDWAEADADRSV
ncbi:MAG TPA: sodium:proton antiporter [Acetobacteraceae bacterium]|jgi:CPA1 family monovalent cation:H+ antiporter